MIIGQGCTQEATVWCICLFLPKVSTPLRKEKCAWGHDKPNRHGQGQTILVHAETALHVPSSARTELTRQCLHFIIGEVQGGAAWHGY